jgi:membrane protease YdiL (CAAX protease family)
LKLKSIKYTKYFFVVLTILLIQQSASKIGGIVANLFNYQKIDPQNVFAFISIHHSVILIISLFLIYILKKLYNIDFGFRVGDFKKGLKYVGIFTFVIFIYTLFNQIIGYYFKLTPPINYILNTKNVLGTLGFQLFLSGPAEELLFRALPISILFFISKRSKSFKWGITIVTIIAAVLFSLAHIQWSISPIIINMDFYQLIYSFVLGIVYGVVYQKTKSIIYPIIMHSLSNVVYVGIRYILIIIF